MTSLVSGNGPSVTIPSVATMLALSVSNPAPGRFPMGGTGFEPVTSCV